MYHWNEFWMFCDCCDQSFQMWKRLKTMHPKYFFCAFVFANPKMTNKTCLYYLSLNHFDTFRLIITHWKWQLKSKNNCFIKKTMKRIEYSNKHLKRWNVVLLCASASEYQMLMTFLDLLTCKCHHIERRQDPRRGV